MLSDILVQRVCLMMRAMQMLSILVMRTCGTSAKHQCDCGDGHGYTPAFQELLGF